MKTDFHNKDFALSLALKWRLRWTRKWPIGHRHLLTVPRMTLMVGQLKKKNQYSCLPLHKTELSSNQKYYNPKLNTPYYEPRSEIPSHGSKYDSVFFNPFLNLQHWMKTTSFFYVAGTQHRSQVIVLPMNYGRFANVSVRQRPVH